VTTILTIIISSPLSHYEINRFFKHIYEEFTAPRELPSCHIVNTITDMLQQLSLLASEHLDDGEQLKHTTISTRIIRAFPWTDINKALSASGFSGGLPQYPSKLVRPEAIIHISNSTYTAKKLVLTVEYTASALSLKVFSVSESKTRIFAVDEWIPYITRPELGGDVLRHLKQDNLQKYFRDLERFVKETVKVQLPHFRHWGIFSTSNSPSTGEVHNFIISNTRSLRIDYLLLLGEQPPFWYNFTDSLQKSLGFNDTVYLRLKNLSQPDMLYESARSAASGSQDSNLLGDFPIKPGCTDAEIAKHWRGTMGWPDVGDVSVGESKNLKHDGAADVEEKWGLKVQNELKV
jgi:hypothetical protein